MSQKNTRGSSVTITNKIVYLDTYLQQYRVCSDLFNKFRDALSIIGDELGVWIREFFTLTKDVITCNWLPSEPHFEEFG